MTDSSGTSKSVTLVPQHAAPYDLHDQHPNCAERRCVRVYYADAVDAEVERLRAALHTAGRNVYQGATSGGWIDHGPDCVAGIRELPCSCGLTEWLVEYQTELGIQLPPVRGESEFTQQPPSAAPTQGAVPVAASLLSDLDGLSGALDRVCGAAETPVKPECAHCHHSYEQHTKGPALATYCRHCPCDAYVETIPKLCNDPHCRLGASHTGPCSLGMP